LLLLIIVLKYFTTEVPENFTTIFAAPSCITKEPEFYTMASKYYTTKAPKLYTTTYAALTCQTVTPK
jgi:hypothetical protein